MALLGLSLLGCLLVFIQFHDLARIFLGGVIRLIFSESDQSLACL